MIHSFKSAETGNICQKRSTRGAVMLRPMGRGRSGGQMLRQTVCPLANTFLCIAIGAADLARYYSLHDSRAWTFHPDPRLDGGDRANCGSHDWGPQRLVRMDGPRRARRENPGIAHRVFLRRADLCLCYFRLFSASGCAEFTHSETNAL